MRPTFLCSAGILNAGGDGVYVYLDLLFLLNFLVDLLLIMATNKLCGFPFALPRAIMASIVGGAYGCICALPEFLFLGSVFWRVVSLGIISVIAFGWNRSTFKRAILFLFISMALGGIAVGIGTGGFASILIAAAAVLLLTVLGFGGKAGQKTFAPVELLRNGKRIRLTALEDTGNTLTDPVTGQRVLVTGPEIAWDLLGLTPEQLLDPITTMEKQFVPGLRLIPYRSVGQPCGFLLALQLDAVRVRGVESGRLVAFSPNSFGNGVPYQALTGG